MSEHSLTAAEIAECDARIIWLKEQQAWIEETMPLLDERIGGIQQAFPCLVKDDNNA